MIMKYVDQYKSNGYSLKIHPDYGDMQISITGSGIRAGDVVVNIATGAQVIRYDTEFKPREYEIRPYLEGSYLYTISNMPSGRNLDVLIRFIKETDRIQLQMETFLHRMSGRVCIKQS